ncbi:hypothetical protein [Candidatus Oscillochloris fontis]|uniref:hypothetical protein n=1 Tax=Candidatus Oscillochloris fontis TaxID=2496868 RepID=UPI00101C1ADF|nr:hypothetical protein [Candidatus Oscillochloris fontis]
MRRSMLVPSFVVALVMLFASACGQSTSTPAASPQSAAQATSAPVATAVPTAVPPTAVPPTEVPTEAPTAAPTEAPAEVQVAPADVFVAASSQIEAGEYFIWLAGCNDCHTSAWETSGGTLPTSEWLTGGRRFSGAYGTTYASNLRLLPENMTAEEFVEMMRARTTNPPMPWAHYSSLHENDLLAVYAYLESLGAKGDPAPPFVPPPAESPTPVPTSAEPTATAVVTPAPTATSVPEDLRPLPPSNAFIQAASPELAGEYFIWVGHCNACHTTDWKPTTPKSDWLTGGRRFNSAGGVAYASNLRLLPQEMTEEEFVAMMQTREEHPPMGWINYHNLNEQDLIALYRFFVSLGPKGEPAPPYEPPASTN